MQLKVKNCLLRKEIETIRQQNIYIQTSYTSLENQLSTDSLHTTELEQIIINDQFKHQQLQDNYNLLIEKVNKLEIDRHESLVNQADIIREKDQEIKKLATENHSLKIIIERSEVSYSCFGVCMCICIYLCIDVYLRIFIRLYFSFYVCMYIFIYLYVY